MVYIGDYKDMTRYGLVHKDDDKVFSVILWDNSEWLPPADYLIVRHDRIDRDDQYDKTEHSFVKWNCGTKHKVDVKSFHALVDDQGKIRNIIIRDDSEWVIPRNHKRVTVSAQHKIGESIKLEDQST